MGSNEGSRSFGLARLTILEHDSSDHFLKQSVAIEPPPASLRPDGQLPYHCQSRLSRSASFRLSRPVPQTMLAAMNSTAVVDSLWLVFIRFGQVRF